MPNDLFKALRESESIRQYLLVTGNYWAFTISDGALRMLVVLYFHQLGYAPLEIALLFVFYEFFGIVTNLLGGWFGAYLGLNKTMNIGLGLQVIALSMLCVSHDALTTAWVMAAQALSGVAKDLNKMSAKSAIKSLVPSDASNTLYKWVARLTGSKNTLKGVGFFVGGGLLNAFGFQTAVLSMAIFLLFVWVLSIFSLKKNLGKAKTKPKIRQLFSKSFAINRLSLARLFLFAARDVWFVIALPVYFSKVLGWSHWAIGAFMASWIIMYGLVQTQAPRLTQSKGTPDGRMATQWAISLSFIPAAIAIGLTVLPSNLESHVFMPSTLGILMIGLTSFGFVFAINSSIHSFLVVHFADSDSVAMDVGFYYMANAAGRLLGTILSGWVFQAYGLIACLIVSSVFIAVAAILSKSLPNKTTA